MLYCDELLYQKSSGQVGDALEIAIKGLSKSKDYGNSPFGAIIPLDLFLLNKQKAVHTILQTIQQYWGSVDLFLFDILQESSIEVETANERLTQFFSSTLGQRTLLHYIETHNIFRFENLIHLVFGKEIKVPQSVGGLNCIYFFKVGKKYFIQIIYSQNEKFWSFLFIKKVYAVFLQSPVVSIDNFHYLMKQLKVHLETLYSRSKAVSMTHHLIKQIEFENPKSFQLKELQLQNVTNHFNGGKRHRQKVSKLIEEMLNSWSEGQWALTEKEKTILTYMLAMDSYNRLQFDRTSIYGEYLIQNDRLNDHAIELILEYSDVLPTLKPEPLSLIKNYQKNYLENIFFILIDSYIQQKQYKEVVRLMTNYEIASCSAIYNFLNQITFDDNGLHRIEATVQRDIAFIVDQNLRHVMHSIEIWNQSYQNESSSYYELAFMSSKHISNILKALFATEHFDLFDKLMETYAKYLKFDVHFNELRDFAAVYIKK